MWSSRRVTWWATRRTQRDLSTSLSATATSLKIKVDSVREIRDPLGEKRSWRETLKRLRRVDHTLLCLASSRREGVSLTSSLTRTFLSVLFYIFYRSLSSHTRSRDFPLAFLILSSLLYFRFFLCLSFCSPFASLSFFRFVSSFSILRHICRAACFSVTLKHPPHRIVWPSSSLFSFSLLSSACLPSSSRTGRSCRARGWLASSWPTG